jgi:hypothetical protein
VSSLVSLRCGRFVGEEEESEFFFVWGVISFGLQAPTCSVRCLSLCCEFCFGRSSILVFAPSFRIRCSICALWYLYWKRLVDQNSLT